MSNKKRPLNRGILGLAALIPLLAATPAMAADEALIKRGEQLFNQNCKVCHQADGVGKTGFAPSLTNPEFLSVASEEFLEGTIRDGRIGTAMPPFAHLGMDNIKAIIAFLKSHATLPDRSKEVDAQPKARGSVKNGDRLFHEICATCHGMNGDGYAAGGTGTAIGNPGFLSKASDGFIRETIKNGRSFTRMRGFQGADGLANLTDQEIDDIIVYLRSLQK